MTTRNGRRIVGAQLRDIDTPEQDTYSSADVLTGTGGSR
jgi:hypothetical protein